MVNQIKLPLDVDFFYHYNTTVLNTFDARQYVGMTYDAKESFGISITPQQSKWLRLLKWFAAGFQTMTDEWRPSQAEKLQLTSNAALRLNIHPPQ